MRLPALIVVVASASWATVPMRRETDVRFAPDDAYLGAGGVQYYFELALREPSPDTASPAFALFKVLDDTNRWKPSEPFHVIVSRLVYEVDKDVSFFTAAQARDLDYINTVAKDYRISVQPDGGLRAAAMPANSISLGFFDRAALAAQAATSPQLARVFEFVPSGAQVESVAFQRNQDFARVLGWRTAELSVTWTAHVAVGPGRTRLYVLTMSYLHSLPPFFLGGEKRVFRESVDGARDLIEKLRAYQPP